MLVGEHRWQTGATTISCRNACGRTSLANGGHDDFVSECLWANIGGKRVPRRFRVEILVGEHRWQTGATTISCRNACGRTSSANGGHDDFVSKSLWANIVGKRGPRRFRVGMLVGEHRRQTG